MEQQVSNKEKALYMQVNDLNVTCIELRSIILDYQDEVERLKSELTQYKEDNARLEESQS